MKRVISLAAICAVVLFTSCGGGNSNSSATATDSTSGQSSSSSAASGGATATANANPGSDIPGIESIVVNNTIDLTADDGMKYNYTLFKVNVGQPVTLTLKNVGSMPAAAMSHDCVVLKAGTDFQAFGKVASTLNGKELPANLAAEVVSKTKMLGPGESATITFTLSKPGVYPFLCTFPGHYLAMNGKIVAVAQPAS